VHSVTHVAQRSRVGFLVLAVAMLALMTRSQEIAASWHLGRGGLLLNRACLRPDTSEPAQHRLLVRARSALYRALAHHPGAAGAYYNLGAVYTAWEDPEPAALALAQAVARAPDVLSVFQLGQAQALLGREMAARAAWRQASAASYFVNQAAASLKSRDYAGALLAAERATAVDPDLAPAHLARGRALEGLGRHQDALGAFETAAALASHKPEALYRAALLLERRLARTVDAVTLLDRALEIDPAYAPALLERARHEASAADCAAVTLRLAPLLAPGAREANASRAAVQIGACYLDTGDPAAALPVLMQAVALDSNSIRATWLLAGAYRGTGDHEAALIACRRVLALQPDHADAQALLEELSIH
jgi:protein O-GlcNAc transferase